MSNKYITLSGKNYNLTLATDIPIKWIPFFDKLAPDYNCVNKLTVEEAIFLYKFLINNEPCETKEQEDILTKLGLPSSILFFKDYVVEKDIIDAKQNPYCGLYAFERELIADSLQPILDNNIKPLPEYNSIKLRDSFEIEKLLDKYSSDGILIGPKVFYCLFETSPNMDEYLLDDKTEKQVLEKKYRSANVPLTKAINMVQVDFFAIGFDGIRFYFAGRAVYSLKQKTVFF